MIWLASWISPMVWFPKWSSTLFWHLGSSPFVPPPSGSFLLLASFRRYTFRLTETSVSHALAFCLGGSPAGFHVQFLSDRHFHFSVSCKKIGFHIYALRCFIGTSFDVYFHMRNNGTAHWEREKLLWEKEQEEEWTKVLSKRDKRAMRRCSTNQPAKKVRFVKPLVQENNDSNIIFGSFCIAVNSSSIPLKRVFGSLKDGLNSAPCSSAPVHEPGKSAPM